MPLETGKIKRGTERRTKNVDCGIHGGYGTSLSSIHFPYPALLFHTLRCPQYFPVGYFSAVEYELKWLKVEITIIGRFCSFCR